MRTEYDSIIGDIGLEDVTMANYSELTYLGNVIQEALRVNPPVTISSNYHFEHDTKIGKLLVKAYDPICISIYPMHQSTKLWKEPSRFNPDRFDLSNPDSLTPDG